MEEQFKKMLNEKEEIVKVSTASKSFRIRHLVSLLIPFIIILLAFGLPYFLDPYHPETKELYGSMYHVTPEGGIPITFFLIPVIIAFVFFTLIYIASIMYNKNYAICLTNQRVIIKSGVFNVNFNNYAIENVSGNIKTSCTHSVFEGKNANACKIQTSIELLPVGHSSIAFVTTHINDGYDFAKALETIVKANANKKQSSPKKKKTIEE